MMPSTSSPWQYSGFLAVILIVELTLAVTLYTYKDHLTSGLKKGLNQSLQNYGPSAVMQSADFDAMQENVSTRFDLKVRNISRLGKQGMYTKIELEIQCLIFFESPDKSLRTESYKLKLSKPWKYFKANNCNLPI